MFMDNHGGSTLFMHARAIRRVLPDNALQSALLALTPVEPKSFGPDTALQALAVCTCSLREVRGSLEMWMLSTGLSCFER